MLSFALLAAAEPQQLRLVLAWGALIGGALVAALLLRAFYFRVGRIVGTLDRIEARLGRLEASATAAPALPASQPAAAAPLATVVEGRPWAPQPQPQQLPQAPLPGGTSTTGEVPGKVSPAGMHQAVLTLGGSGATEVTVPAVAPAPAVPAPAVPAPAVPAPAVPAPAAAVLAAGAAAVAATSTDAAAGAAPAAAEPEPILTPVAAMPALIAERERTSERRLTEPAVPGHPAPLGAEPQTSGAPALQTAPAAGAVAVGAPGDARPPTAELPWLKKQDTDPGLAAASAPAPAPAAAPAAGKLSPPPEGSRYCPYCGHATSKRNLFCHSCESKLP